MKMWIPEDGGKVVKVEVVPVRPTCPDCGSSLMIRSSRALSRITRELYMLCCNPHCPGARFKGLLSITERLVLPQAVPANIHIPVSPRCVPSMGDKQMELLPMEPVGALNTS